MVFESVVVDVLNRFLGDYVENLDGSQLKLGIWGGDVVLKDLHLKDSALQDLDLPIKTVSGYLGQLVLKIPWKQLYTAPVVVLVERLHLLAVPSQEVAYDREKEEAIVRDLKRQAISRYEQVQQLANTKEALKEQKDDTFVEKLVTQIIKNVQVTVKGIHIRYEDQNTVPGMPFAVGVSLHELSLESTDNHWKPAIVTDTVKQIYKMVNLDSLSVYWNSRTQLYTQMSREERDARFLSDVATSTTVPPDMKFVLGPINANAQLKLNPKPEFDGSSYRIPKVWLNLVLEQLDIGITKYQYRDMMELLQGMERMNVALPYRKYRPQLQYSGHARQWWLFAYKCVLNETVRRRRRNWAWVHMKHYRDMCRRYSKAYLTKLTNKKPPIDVLARIEDYEFKLDIVNVIMIRQKVQLEAEKLAEKQKRDQKNAGWFGGWFSGGSTTNTSVEDDLAKQFEAAMTPAERQRLYSAIDYQENAAPTVYPVEFEAVQLAFRLGRLAVTVRDEEATPSQVLALILRGVDASLVQRPAAAAVRVESSINELLVEGIPKDGKAPAIATTRAAGSATALVTAQVETNPLDGECDHRVRARSQPVEMVFHAETFLRLAAVFKPPQHIQLSQLQAAAMNKLQELKDTSALKMQYAIQTHKTLELEVDLMASQLLVPEFGDLNRQGRVLAVNLGSVRVRSVPRQLDTLSIKQMALAGTSSQDIFNKMAAQAYDQFDVDLEDIEVVLAVPGESWKEALRLSGSPQHLVRPISVSVCVKKCLITDDPRLPVIKVDAAIPKLSISISDFRLTQLAVLGNSIPTAPPEPQLALPTVALDSNANVLSVDRSNAPLPTLGGAKTAAAKSASEEQITDLLLNFTIQELMVDVYRRHSVEQQGTADRMVSLLVGSIGCAVTMRTHSLLASSSLAGVSIKSHEFKDPDGGDLFLVSTPMTRGGSEPLLSCSYKQVERGWAQFWQETGGVAQLVELKLSELTVQLHQAALCSLMTFGDALRRQLEEVAPPPAAGVASAVTAADTSAAGATSAAPVRANASSSSRKHDIVDMKVAARFNDFRVVLSSSGTWLADAELGDMQLGAELRRDRTRATAGLSQLAVRDLTPGVKHTQILSMTSEEVFHAEVCMYNRAPDADPSAVDMDLTAQLGGVRFVFINRFLLDIMAFMTPFSATQEALAEASQTAAEAAQQAMHSAYAQAFKAKLAVVMKAPVIVVPQSSSSDWALVADLGTLSVKNDLEMGPKNQRGAPAVLDVMKLKLDDFKFSRVSLPEGGSPVTECLLLRPVTLELQVTRNLSAGWYHKKPEVDVRATLGGITLVLSEEDYKQIMATLNENFSESGTSGLDVLPEKVTPTLAATAAVVATTAAHVEVAVPAAAAAAAAAAASAAAPAAIDGPPHTKLLFSFHWAFVGIELLNSPAQQQLAPGTDCRKGCLALGTFGLHQLEVDGQMNSDGAMSCSVSLEDCILQDTRPNMATCFPRLMEKVTRSGKPKAGMINVVFDQKGNLDRALDAKVSSVSLILYLPYLMLLAEFFTKNMPEAPPRKPAPPPAAKTATGKPQRPTTLETTPPSASAPGGRMVLKLKVDRPDIALVEDLTDINTRAVVFDNEIDVKVQQTSERTSVMGEISRIQLFTCVYNPAERDKTMNEIVSPFSISVMGGITQGEGTRLQVEVTDVKLHVNAAAIHLLTSISSGMGSDSARPEEPVQKAPDWGRLWDTRHLSTFNFWFLEPEAAEEALEEVAAAVVAPAVAPATAGQMEQLIFKASALKVTVEQVVGVRNVPLVLLDSALEAQVKDWSSKLRVESTLTMELGYYNSRLAVWEPIVECVERREAGMVSFSPWALQMKVERNEDVTEITSPLSPMSVSSEAGAESVNFQPPGMSVYITTKDPLEITVTRTCLDVLTDLQESLAGALELSPPVAGDTDAHFLIRNRLEHEAIVVTGGKYTVHGSDVGQVVLEQGAEAPLMCSDGAPGPAAAAAEASRTILVKIPSMSWSADIPVARAESRYFRVQRPGAEACGIIADIRAHFDSKVVTLRSCVQVENHQSVPVKVYYMNAGGNELQCVGVAEPDSTLALPFSAVYSNTAELFFGVEGYTVTVAPFVWRDMQNNPDLTMMLKCGSKTNQAGHPFNMLCHGEMKPVFFETSRAKTLASRSYRIHVRAPAVLSNLLPVALTYLRPGDLAPVTLEPGGTCQMPTAQPGDTISLKLSSYLDRSWSCVHQLEEEPEELSVWTFLSADGDHQADLGLGMHTRKLNGSQLRSIYAPFWMINRTGKMLTYKHISKKPPQQKTEQGALKSIQNCIDEDHSAGDSSNLIYHPETMSEPVLFSFKPSSFFSKKKASVRVEGSEWSEKFSLDTVGSSGTVTCPTHNMEFGRRGAAYPLPDSSRPGMAASRARTAQSKSGSAGTAKSGLAKYKLMRHLHASMRRRRGYTISVQIHLSRSGLTRQVYFLPSVVVANNAPYDIQVHEPAEEEDWITVPANSCQPFWPHDRKRELRCRVAGTAEETTYFCYKTTNSCLLYLPNNYGGISLSVQVDEASTIVTLDDYVDGMATVRIVNHTTDHDIAYRQKKHEQASNGLSSTRSKSVRGPSSSLRRKSVREPSSSRWSQSVRESTLAGAETVSCASSRPQYRSLARASSELISQELSRLREAQLTALYPDPQTCILSPGEVRLYTWERPAGERVLSWSCGKVKGHLEELVKDGIEEFEGNNGQTLYWVSFLDGMQRTLMFTPDLAVATQAQNAVELERIDQEVTIEIEGIGLSLVNNISQTDVMYMGITSSGVIWETQKAHGKRFRAMTGLQCALLERAHQNFINQVEMGVTPAAKLTLENKMQVDFHNMQLVSPNKRYLRRSFQSGVWLQLRTSAHQRQIHAKLNRLQLDNQLRDSVFPVVLAPVPPPKSIAADSVPKPFVEMSVVERLAEHTLIKQYKYCKMLIQEFHVKLDQGFLSALMGVLSVDKLNKNTKELVESDLEVAMEELKQKVAIRSMQEQRNFYDFLHFSPLKIHVSFSMTGAGSADSGGSPVISSGFIDLLLQSVGVTLTEIQDVVFKLAYFQREHQFMSQADLTSAVTAHYTGQAIKQLYVLVLGLDVIGNPFGLVVGLTDGVSDLFYEPVQGAIQGPGEFAEGLALGVTSLFSHAVGGTAGAVSRITGTLGKGIAALTLDQEYQQKRREALNRRPADFTSGIAQSGRGLFMGVVDGVTGVVRKPIEGAQEEGALGFVKGMGKGMVGLFTRPTSGVVDFASGSFDAVKSWRKQTDLKFVKKLNRWAYGLHEDNGSYGYGTMDQEEVVHLRPPRHFQADKIIRPYVRHEAEGAKMLLELEKGRYATTDAYVAHAICRPDRRVVFLLTDFRVLLLTRNEIFGSWQVEWTFMWKELPGAPTVSAKGLELRVPAAKKGFSLFGSSEGTKLVPITDRTSAEWMKQKMVETMRQYNV